MRSLIQAKMSHVPFLILERHTAPPQHLWGALPQLCLVTFRPGRRKEIDILPSGPELCFLLRFFPRHVMASQKGLLNSPRGLLWVRLTSSGRDKMGERNKEEMIQRGGRRPQGQRQGPPSKVRAVEGLRVSPDTPSSNRSCDEGSVLLPSSAHSAIRPQEEECWAACHLTRLLSTGNE